MAKKKTKVKKLNFLERMEAEGRVLCAKVGHEQKFIDTLAEMHKIGHGALGWDGQADMMIELGLDQALEKDGVKFPKSAAARKKKMRQILVGSFVDTLYQYGEWIPAEEAKNRKEYSDILFNKDLDGKSLEEATPTQSGVDDPTKP